ncbi:OB-fold-containig protein [Xanthovirga aplysinae]|uniref:OB-fold-containig protein n=1 Tax=Xanthovirga aplysinae TaxID=2529853 RepID=UPI0012BCBEB4|nr:OB-fold-containig protein [Xanthovirga aplysinae]MTI32289.1 DUF1449 family protein [Xanthovirga aplysinae]
MSELFSASVSVVNIIPTTLLVFILIYWVTVILGVLDFNFLDFDLELDLELDAEADGEISVAWLNSVLAFFNLGKVPFMVFMSFLALPLWIISVLSNHFLGNTSILIALLILLADFFISLFVAKFLTMPLIKLFGKMEEDTEGAVTVVGKICTVLLRVEDGKLGQAKVNHSGSPILLNVRSAKGVSLKKGETGLVIDYLESEKIYLIEPYK